MKTKYGFDISKEVLCNNMTRLTNQLWKIIPMYENTEDWRKQLSTVLIEIRGLNEIFSENSLFLQLLGKLEGIMITKDNDIDFAIVRKTIFESINILQGFKNA